MSNVNPTPATTLLRRSPVSRLNLVLAALVLVQAVLVFVLFRPQAALSASGGPLLGELSVGDVTALSITDNLGRTIAFERSGDGWVLAGTDGWPANGQKIEDTLNKLLGIKTERQVTRTAASHARLQVAADNYQRRITVSAPGGSTTLLLGSSAGAAATHVRAENADPVYLTGAIAAWELDTFPSSWSNTAYFNVETGRIRSLTVANANGEFTILPNGEEWTLADLSPDETPLINNLRGLVSRAASISLSRPLGTRDDPAYGLDTPQATLTLVVEDEQGNEVTHTLLVGNKDSETNTYYFKASNSNHYVTVPGFTGDEFTRKTRADLISATPASTPEATPAEPDATPTPEESALDPTPEPPAEEPTAEEPAANE